MASRSTRWFVGFGLLPLWAAIVIVVGGSFVSTSHDYWNVAPWLIVAALPASGVTSLIVAVAVVAGGKARGDATRRDLVKTRTFVIGVLLLAAFAAGGWWRSHQLERAKREETVRVLELVKRDPQVVGRVGPETEVSLQSSRGSSGTMPVAYNVSVRRGYKPGLEPMPPTFFAIVKVREAGGERRLVVECVAPERGPQSCEY